jgi:hypothetical protein
MMIAVDGIILVLSCQKHLHTRLKELRLPKGEYAGWKVVYVIGDLFLDCDYTLRDDLMVVKCEDSYIHLLKKLGLALKYLYAIFDIKEGVLRANDDLIFNEAILEAFLRSPKTINANGESDGEEIHFLGRSSSGKSLFERDLSVANKPPSNSNHLVYYYNDHPEDFENPQHNIKGVDISRYTKQPCIPAFLFGPLYYLSNKTAGILVEHLESIQYDVFHYDERTDSYPYTIEDCGVSFIFYYKGINFIHAENWHHNDDNYVRSVSSVRHENNTGVMAIHTNMYK